MLDGLKSKRFADFTRNHQQIWLEGERKVSGFTRERALGQARIRVICARRKSILNLFVS